MTAAPARPLRVLHLAGSAVDPLLRDVSLLYARNCLAATADPARYEPVLAVVEPDGRWRFPTGLSDAELAQALPLERAAAVARLAGTEVDVAVPQMFCVPGMTTYRALLELLGIPYAGNRPDVMALGADKAKARAVVAAAGVAVPEGEVVPRGGRTALAPPVVVKPVDADNSVGVTLVEDPGGLGAALAAAWEHGSAALVERYVPLGREVRCGVLERDGELLCLPLEEYAVDAAHPVRTHADKLARDGAGELHLVAKDARRAWLVDPADPVTAPVHALARAVHRALGCRHYSLVDVRVDPAGTPWFLEASLYCSFAEQSVLCAMARGAGIGVPELFAEVLDRARRDP